MQVRVPGALPYDHQWAAEHHLPNPGLLLKCINPNCDFLRHSKFTVADSYYCCEKCMEASKKGWTPEQCIAAGFHTHGRICEHRPVQG
jgi:hypothetical protein